MNLTCPNCGARFKIKDDALGTKGRKVKCGVAECDHTWFQTTSRLYNLDPSKLELVDYPDSMRQRLKEGKSAEPEIGFRAYVGNLPFEITEDELGDLRLAVECCALLRDDAMFAASAARGAALPGCPRPAPTSA
mgnify:CR=1 FL=1